MWTRISILAVTATAALALSCTSGGGKKPPSSQPPPPTDDGGAGDATGQKPPPPVDDGNKPPADGADLALKPESKSIQTTLVDKQCAGCHTAPSAANHHVDLTDVTKLSATQHDPSGAHSHILIVPGCPNKSLFYGIMKEGKMPPEPAPRVSPDDLAIVAEWITAMVPESERNCTDTDEPGSSNPDPDEPGTDDGGDDEPGD